MLTLALDTTTRAGSVAVTRGDAVLAVVHGDATRTHGERLPGELDRALQQARVAAGDVELLAVASGPGAFTGLRIGLAAMQGLAMVLGVPVVAVSALDALAQHARDVHDADGQIIASWMDAQRGEVFAAHYRPPYEPGGLITPSGVPMVGLPDALIQTIAADGLRHVVFIGDGALRYRSAILERATESVSVIDAPVALAPTIAILGQRLAARGHAGPPHALQPLYVRRSDAELERQRRKSAVPATRSREHS